MSSLSESHIVIDDPFVHILTSRSSARLLSFPVSCVATPYPLPTTPDHLQLPTPTHTSTSFNSRSPLNSTLHMPLGASPMSCSPGFDRPPNAEHIPKLEREYVSNPPLLGVCAFTDQCTPFVPLAYLPLPCIHVSLIAALPTRANCPLPPHQLAYTHHRFDQSPTSPVTHIASFLLSVLPSLRATPRGRHCVTPNLIPLLSLACPKLRFAYPKP